METKKEKNFLMLIGALVVGVMFITSYVAFGSNGSAAPATSTVPQKTAVFFGNANAVVTGYGTSMEIFAAHSNASALLNKTLSSYDAQNSIIIQGQLGGTFEIDTLGNLTAYDIQQDLYNSLPPNSIRINAQEFVRLPNTLTMYSYGEGIPVRLSIVNFTVNKSILTPIGSNITVDVQAQILSNGTIFDNNIKVT